ncbi:MAG: site-specific recombinase [Gemmatimonas sp.]|nr:site-specific recombinase [Gemmatimonas sp.]
MSLRTPPANLPEIEALLREIAQAPKEVTGDFLGRLVALLRPGRVSGAAEAAAPFEGFIALLESRPAMAEALSAHLHHVLLSRMHRTLYADSGILTSSGYLTGFWQRLLGRMLPPAVDPDFLRDLVAEIFDEPHDGEWIAQVPYETWRELLTRLGCYDDAFAPVRRHIRQELLESMRLVGHRLAALGMDPALVRYAPALARHESPFLAQSDEVKDFIARHTKADAPQAHDGHLEILLGHCTDFVAQIRRKSHETGVGVTLVFVLARIEQLVARMRLLRLLAVPDAKDSRDATRTRAVQFMATLIRAENRRNRFGEIFDGTTQLLARRVTEHASKSGEHYVTETRTEYREMFRAAAGAGLLVAVMALTKILTAKLGLPGFWQAVAFSLIYGLGFVLVHILHLTIATKQPAMTAATIAAALDGTPDKDARLDRIAKLAAQVSRTQWVSIAGNVAIGFLTSLAIAMVGARLLGWAPIGTEKAEHLLHELHPWQSLALLHAGVAGVYLFLSGLISGYYDNQSLFHRVPERIRRVKWMKRLFGAARLDRIAHYIEHNLGALAGNFIFGCMLGATGTVGAFFGLPIDIRHVSFSSANLAYALTALDFNVGWQVVVVSAAGVILIALVNLFVSFVLALRVALKSRGIGASETAGLTRRVYERFKASPREFFLPPR